LLWRHRLLLLLPAERSTLLLRVLLADIVLR
jgi:hypothetical protein